jgi:L-fuconolactonase
VGDVLATMREGLSGSALVGVRHLVHDEADPRWLERPDVVRGLQAVADAGLVYDLLVRPPHLPSAVIAVDGVKGGRFVLDHGGKPAIGAGETEPWAGLVSELAARPNVVAKLSGLVTEAGPTWSPDVIRPYVDHLVGAFGPERLLYGSDWPVCLGEASYADVIGLARSLLDDLLGPPETAMVMTANAVRTYGLGERPR